MITNEKPIDFGKLWALYRAGWTVRAISYDMDLGDEVFTEEAVKRIGYGEIGTSETGRLMAKDKAEKWVFRGFPVAWLPTKNGERIAIGLAKAAYDDGFDVREIASALGVSRDSIKQYLGLKKRYDWFGD